MKKQLLILMAFYISSIVYSQTVGDTFVNNFLTYEVTSISPDTVEIIDYDSANGGTTANIPNIVTDNSITYSVTSIGNSAFNIAVESEKMTNVTFTSPSNIINIGDFAFRFQNLTTITIPNSVLSIGNTAFQGNLLTSIIIPNSVTSIGPTAFNNNLLTSVTLSNNITSIENSSFRFNQLQSIVIPNSVTSIENNAFNSNQLTNLVLSNNLTNISIGAFRNNQLTSVTIPSNVTNIENVVFDGNPLTDVYSESTVPPTIITNGTSDTFASDRSTIHLHIPAGTMGDYVTGTGALWTGFNPVTEDALSVSDFELANDIKVVTTTDKIQIISSDNVRLENYTVYNLSGAQVSTGNTNIIATSSFANGIYILKLNFDKGIIAKKILVN